MTDRISKERRSANMARIRSQDTKPELAVRRLLHSLGYRYTLQNHKMPGRPDILFTARRKIIFVHGCFWHQHDRGSCEANRKPKSNTEYWSPKLDRNVARDREHQKTLRCEGWELLVVWECETSDIDALRRRLTDFVGLPRIKSK